MTNWAGAHARAAATEAVKRPVQKQTGAFYDLEFCLWLQRNFDYILANLHRWEQEKTFNDEQRRMLAAYIGSK